MNLKKLKVSIQRKAEITQPFLKLVKRLQTKLFFETPKYTGGRKWITIFKTEDPATPEKFDFYFVQKLGKDSVRFLLLDLNSETPFGCLRQYSSPYGKFINGCFTGSLDKPEKSVEDIVLEEVKEESGFEVGLNRLHKVSSETLGSITNETVHLFIVNVTGLEVVKKDPENLFEANMETLWMGLDEVFEKCEWSAKYLVAALKLNPNHLKELKSKNL
jgi:hypothetical protein